MAKRYNVIMSSPTKDPKKSFRQTVGSAFENVSAGGVKYITVQVPFLPSPLVLFEADSKSPKGKAKTDEEDTF